MRVCHEQNYGYIKDFKAPDGKWQDAYVLGVNEPIKEFIGCVIAIVIRDDDVENKLIVSNQNYDEDEIKEMIIFQEKYFKSRIKKSS